MNREVGRWPEILVLALAAFFADKSHAAEPPLNLRGSNAAPLFRLGGTNLVPGRVALLDVPVSGRGQSLIVREGNERVSRVKMAIAVPEEFDPKKIWPVLVVNTGSGGSAVQSIYGFQKVATKAGWVILAADGGPIRQEKDTAEYRWALLISAFDFLHQNWPESKKWPMAAGGFSGGAKRAAYIGGFLARDNYRVAGLFMGGCNEDRLSLVKQTYHPPAPFYQVPIFLSSGLTDRIATPDHHLAVKKSMEQNGFKNVRLEQHLEGHRLSTDHLNDALIWFAAPFKLGQ